MLTAKKIYIIAVVIVEHTEIQRVIGIEIGFRIFAGAEVDLTLDKRINFFVVSL